MKKKKKIKRKNKNLSSLNNSKTPDLPPFKTLPTLKLFPSSIFFATLFSGSSGYFLASAPGNFPPQEFKKIEDNIRIKIIFKFLKEIIIKLVINLIVLYNIFRKMLKI